jgi:hypothetical protein
LCKFIVDFDEKVFGELDKGSKSRNITFQEFLRAVVITEWIRGENRTMSNHPAMREDSQRE